MATKLEIIKIPGIGLDLSVKQFYFYANSAIIVFGFLVIYYFLKKNNRNIRDEDSYDWSKYTIVSDKKVNNKRRDLKDKVKQRQKTLSKGNGLVKEEHKFPIINPIFHKKDIFLNSEEANNLQDMINYAASINQNEKENIDSNSNEVLLKEKPFGQENNNKGVENNSLLNACEKLDLSFKEALIINEMDQDSKIKKVLELFKQLIKLKNKKLSENTYVGLVELFIVHGYFDHASYFLCQMDKNKVNIPRNLLDLFLEYSIQHKIFEKAEKQKTNNNKKNNKNENEEAAQNKNQDFNPFYNKYDEYDPQNDPDYAYYFSKKNVSKQRKDINNIFSSLKIDSKPFFPKNFEIKNTFNDFDPKNIKEFIPKGYKIEKKEENKQG